MYQLSVYAVTNDLWRWELRRGGTLLRCGTAATMLAAELDFKAWQKEWARASLPVRGRMYRWLRILRDVCWTSTTTR